MLAQNQLVLRPADILRPHDFVGFAVLQHAVLMNPGFVGKGIGTDHRLVRLHRVAGNLRNQAWKPAQSASHRYGFDRKYIATRAHRHHDFFQRSIASALAKTVDRALDLPCAGQYRGQRIGDSQTRDRCGNAQTRPPCPNSARAQSTGAWFRRTGRECCSPRYPAR
jgi:hypothetical protein